MENDSSNTSALLKRLSEAPKALWPEILLLLVGMTVIFRSPSIEVSMIVAVFFVMLWRGHRFFLPPGTNRRSFTGFLIFFLLISLVFNALFFAGGKTILWQWSFEFLNRSLAVSKEGLIEGVWVFTKFFSLFVLFFIVQARVSIEAFLFRKPNFFSRCAWVFTLGLSMFSVFMRQIRLSKEALGLGSSFRLTSLMAWFRSVIFVSVEKGLDYSQRVIVKGLDRRK